MILDPNGLYDGDRINACSKMARLYYPWIIAASNSCGRLLIDYTAIVSKAFFRWPYEDKPSEAELRSYIKEYAANYLIFLYRINRQEWGQWDTAKCTFGKYRNTQDMRSPEPDAKEFEEWRNTYKRNKIFKYEKVNPNDFQINSGQIQIPFQGKCDGVLEVGDGVGVGTGVGIRCEVLGVKNLSSEPDYSEQIARIISKHPRMEVPVETERAIILTAIPILNRRGMSDQQALDWLEAKVEYLARCFAQWSNDDQKHCRASPRWFSGGGYDETEESWLKKTERKGLSKNGKTELTTAEQSDLVVNAVFARRTQKGNEVGPGHVPSSATPKP